MQVNRISSTPFTSGMLYIFNSENSEFENLEADKISKISLNHSTNTTYITVPDYDKIFDDNMRGSNYTKIISLKVPIERVLAAYTAAMVAPSNTRIDVL